MLQPGRKYSAGSKYRYGFNGKENDNEVKGEGGQQDYGMRIYDPRLGKFLSVDPLTGEYAWYTPYQFAGNKPIRYIDRDGKEEDDPASMGDPGYAMGKTFLTEFDKLEEKDPVRAKQFGKTYAAGCFATLAAPFAGTATGLKVINYLYWGYQAQKVIGIMNKPGNTPEQRKENAAELKEAAADVFIGWGVAKFVGGVFSAVRSGIPQGLSASEFKVASQRIYNEVKNISEDIYVHGSRAAGTARLSSDIDFAIRVNSKEFDQLIVKAFGSPKVGTANWKTMQNAIQTGKISSGRIGLRSLRKNLEKLLGKDVHISIIKKGGDFDNGIIIPVKKP